MRVLSNTPAGKVILNPIDIVALVAQSPQKAAAVVVVGKDLIVSTAFTDHNSMLNAAGFEVRNYELEDDCDPVLVTFRGGMTADSITFDIWHRGDQDKVGEYVDSIKSAFDFLSSHRKLKNIGSLEIAVYDTDYVQTHTFDSRGLIDERQDIAMRGASIF